MPRPMGQGGNRSDPPDDIRVIFDQCIVFVYPGISDDGSFAENNVPFA